MSAFRNRMLPVVQAALCGAAIGTGLCLAVLGLLVVTNMDAIVHYCSATPNPPTSEGD